jgi:hypothetical protein
MLCCNLFINRSVNFPANFANFWEVSKMVHKRQSAAIFVPFDYSFKSSVHCRRVVFSKLLCVIFNVSNFNFSNEITSDLCV